MLRRRNFECACRVMVKCTDRKDCRLKCKAACNPGVHYVPNIETLIGHPRKGTEYSHPTLDDFYDAVPVNQPEPYDNVVADTNPVNPIADEQGLGPNFSNSEHIWGR